MGGREGEGATAEPTRGLHREPRLLVLTKERSVELALPSAASFVLGRAADCDVVVDDPSVSRAHARITRSPGLAVEDLGSKSGTKVGNVVCAPGTRVAIRFGEPIALGDAILIVVGADAASPDGVAPTMLEGRPTFRSVDMSELVDSAEKLAQSDIPVVLVGATGAGKERLARWVHRCSARARSPFVAVDLSTVTPQLLESSLFGHVKGAFTGADRDRTGLLVSAHGGTVFFDAVDELPLALQSRLLRAVEDRRVIPVGAEQPIEFDARYISAASRDLGELAASGAFRQDLYFRLAGAVLHVPPLSSRPEDIVPIAEELLAEIVVRHALPGRVELDAEAVEVLRDHRWPGNVRELRNVLERAALLSRRAVLRASDLELGDLAERRGGKSLKDSVHDHIRRRVTQALEIENGNQTRAARRLGIGRRTLIDHMQRYGIERPPNR